MSLFGGGPGFEVPKGSPGDLHDAAAVFGATADTLDTQANALDSTSLTVGIADWQGYASAMYAGASGDLAAAMRDGSSACRAAASACRQFASKLQDAKHRAKAALHDANHAIDVGQKAEQAYADAKGAADSASQRASTFADNAMRARAHGPAGEASAQTFDGMARQASGEYDTAVDTMGRAKRKIDDAKTDLDDARKRGTDAENDAEKAGKHASTALEHDAGSAKAPEFLIRPAVPVTIRDQANPLLAVAGSPFANRFGVTPGDIRKQQIAAALKQQEELDKKRQGGMDDSLGGGLDAWFGTNFGIGDKKTRAYQGDKKWQEMLTFVPTPAGARAQVERQAVKHGVKEGAEREANHLAKKEVAAGVGRQQERKFWTRTHRFEEHKVYQRDDLIDPAKTDWRGRSNVDRMKKGLAPLGPDGKPMELHHTTQRDDGAVAEVTHSFHKDYSKEIHVNSNKIPSGIDRTAFATWRRHYWKDRAAMLAHMHGVAP